MAAARVELNAATGMMEAMYDIKDESKYTLEKPRKGKPPSTRPEFKARCLWIHNNAGYVVWMASTNYIVVYIYFKDVQLEEDMTHEHTVGSFIDEYKFDKAAYASKQAATGVPPAKKQKASASSPAAPPPATPAPPAPSPGVADDSADGKGVSADAGDADRSAEIEQLKQKLEEPRTHAGHCCRERRRQQAAQPPHLHEEQAEGGGCPD